MALVRRTEPDSGDRPSIDRDELERILLTGTADERRLGVRHVPDGPGVSTLLGEALGDEQDPATIELIFARLARIADTAALELLRDLLASEDTLLRNRAIEALQMIGEGARDTVLDALADRDPDVRILALTIVPELAPDTAQKMLMDVLECERDVNVCASAVEALAAIGDGATVELLEIVRLRFEHEPSLCFAIDFALDQARSMGSTQN